jgi:hypothetical protein
MASAGDGLSLSHNQFRHAFAAKLSGGNHFVDAGLSHSIGDRVLSKNSSDVKRQRL